MDYGEILCKAIGMISEQVSGQIKSDKTVVCIIIDDSSKLKGEYKVIEGSVKYTAYSTLTDYKKDDVVYVQIPEGNYDEQKFIIGKKLKSNELNYNFVSPLKNFVKIETYTLEGQYSLTANGSSDKGTIEIKKIEKKIKGYSYMGISANFSSWLGGTIREGNYGLIIQLNNNEEILEHIVFDSKDMNGPIYSFNEPSPQEILLDISDYELITSITIYFYQLNNFINNKGNKIVKSSSNNLHVNNISLSFGMKENEIKAENLFLYTDDKITYNGEKKKLNLRWIRYNKENKKITLFNPDSDITELNKDQNKIIWYRYNTGAQKKDIYAGENWEEIKTKDLSFSVSITPDAESKSEEKYKAILFLYGKDKKISSYYESNILTFTNQNEIINQTTLNAVYGLTLKPEDGLNGYYNFYDMSNSLFNVNNAQQERHLQCYFKEQSTETETQKLKQANYICWYVPRTNSMLQFESYFNYPYYNNSQLNELSLKENDIYGLIGEDNIVREYYQINNKGEQIRVLPNIQYGIDAKQTTESHYAIIPFEDEDKIIKQTYLPYRIKTQYKKEFSNNLIKCQVKIDKIIYQNEFNFNFGNGGTSGSEVTLILQLLDGEMKIGENSWIFNDSINCSENLSDVDKKYIGVEAQVFDTQGKRLTEEEMKDFKFSFNLYNPYNKNAKSNLKLVQNLKNNIAVYEIVSIENNNIDIIECKLSNYQEYNLINYIGIPLKLNETYYNKIIGPDTLVIDTSGQVAYDNINYTLIDKEGKKIYPEGLKWRIITETRTEGDKANFDNFIPTIEPPQQEYQDINPDNMKQVLDPESSYIIEFKDADKAYEIKVDTSLDNNNFPQITIEDSGETVEYINTIHISGSETKTIYDYLKRHNDPKDAFIILNMKRKLKPSELKWKLKTYDLILDNCPKLAIQAYKETFISEDSTAELIYFQTPLIVLHNTWISKIINEWDGKKLGINEEEGYLLGKMLAAGSKNEDNEFSGVILGDWKNTEAQSALTGATGLYGFNDGIMSFSFTDDGKATIGKKGAGQLRFDGNVGTIQSGSYQLSNGAYGAKIDFTKGIIDLNNADYGNICLNSSEDTAIKKEMLDEEKGLEGIVASVDGITPIVDIYLIKENDNWYQIEYIKENNKYTGNFKYIYDDNNKKVKGQPIPTGGFPLTIGKNFKASWDGTIFANNGTFNGIINAKGGNILGDITVKGNLNGATIKSGKFIAEVGIGGYYGDRYEKVIILPETINLIIEGTNDYRYYKIENNEYTALKSEDAVKKAFKANILEERIKYWIPVSDNGETNYMPIQFEAKDGEKTSMETIAEIGVIRTLTLGSSNMFGIRTLGGSKNLTTDIGFDAGGNAKMHGKLYSGISIGEKFTEPSGAIEVQNVDGTIEAKIIADKITLKLGEGNWTTLEDYIKQFVISKDAIVSMINEALSNYSPPSETE